jgi:hypothetical protein
MTPLPPEEDAAAGVRPGRAPHDMRPEYRRQAGNRVRAEKDHEILGHLRSTSA